MQYAVLVDVMLMQCSADAVIKDNFALKKHNRTLHCVRERERSPSGATQGDDRSTSFTADTMDHMYYKHRENVVVHIYLRKSSKKYYFVLHQNRQT